MYIPFLGLKHFLFFISWDIFTSKFWDIKVIVFQSEINRGEKEVLLLYQVDAYEELAITFKKTLAAISILVKDSAFF